MSTQSVKAIINGTTYDLTYNSTTGKWEATIPAPNKSSYNEPGNVFNVELTATNDAGSTATIDNTNDEFAAVLSLRVLEKQAPSISFSRPASGAYITTARPTVKFTVIDNSIGDGGDSGVNPERVLLKVDNNTVSNTILHSAVPGGYEFTCQLSALAEGNHTITVTAGDFDGNTAETNTSFKVDTVPPTLNITTPVDGAVFNNSALVITGSTNDETSTSVEVKITVNGVDSGVVTVGGDGSFTHTVELNEGSNTIVVTSTDLAGKSSSVTRNVTLDTSIPQFISVSLTPNPADAGATLTLSVEVE